MTKIQAKLRDIKENKDTIRKEGSIPAVVYGPKTQSFNVSVLKNDFMKAFKEAGESTALTLSVDGKDHAVLIHDVSYDPVLHTPIHADFYAADMNRPIQVSVPIEFEGIAPAVKSAIGTLVKALHEIEVEALPKDLPHQIVISIEGLTDLDSQILAGDVVLPKGVTLVTKETEVVVAIANLAKDEPVEAPVMDLSSIEVEKKGKKEEEGEEA
jgi:large subunit ribosomal protein L25